MGVVGIGEEAASRDLGFDIDNGACGGLALKGKF